MEHPDTLYVMGNGKQRKSYLYVQDCLDAMLLAIDNARAEINIFKVDIYLTQVTTTCSMAGCGGISA